MKVLNSPAISPFGGINFVIKEAIDLNINKLIENNLPPLPQQSTYNWFDIIMSYWSVFFCGGDCAEDLAINLKDGLLENPFIKIPSPDRVLERLKSLSVPSVVLKTKKGKSKNQFSIHEELNLLNIQLLNKLSTFQKKDVTLDYDNTIIYTSKADAKYAYTKSTGYCPGVGIIDNHVVYVENRNGNCASHTLQDETIDRMMLLLKQENISVKTIRADSASYAFDIVTTMLKHAKTIFVRAKLKTTVIDAISQISEWNQIKVGNEIMYRGTVNFVPFKEAARKSHRNDDLREFRLVITKKKNKTGQLNVFTGEACEYSAIMTNDFDMTDDQVVNFYNQRGAKEREFDVMKNDFGWNNMPFSRLEQNTVFLIITAMCRNFYNHIITVFSKRVKGLNAKSRIKKFIFRFICIPAKWIKTGRSMKLRLYGEIAFRT